MSSRRRGPRTRLPAAVAIVSTLALAACGTRLPDDDFVQAQQGAVLVPGPDGTLVPGVVPSGSAAPGVDPTASSRPGAGPQTTAGPGGSDGGNGNVPGAANNTASDIGVTPTTITIGNISSKDNVFDPRAFVGPLYGLQAFVRWTNARGGINGRQIILKTCNDQGSGDANVSCAHQLIDNDNVFAMVANAILAYDGASYVNAKGVPDMGAQPIDNAYQRYPHLWDIYGEYYPRDGKQVGFDGTLYGGTEVYKYFTRKFPDVAKVAGVVMYNQSASERFGDSIVSGLKYEGYRVVKKVVNFALPDYDSVAIDFRNEGVRYVYDTIDREGNVRLCKALDDNSVDLVAKVLTTQSWEQSVADDYRESPGCRTSLWATGMTRNYADTQYAQVRNFRQQMAADGHGGADQLSEWALEGWAAGVWFADAAESCGAELTRRCFESFINSGKPYDGRGLLVPRWFEQLDRPEAQSRNCINVARWVDSRGWVTQVPDMNENCFTLKEQPYAAG